jgi:alpha-1,6-mannosyltransferase
MRAFVAALAACLLLVVATWVAGRFSGSLSSFVWWTSLSAVGCGVAVAVAGTGRSGRGAVTGLIILLALSFRLILLPSTFEISEDAARYHWDGKVLAAGVNPYLHPPNAPVLDHLRGDRQDELISDRSERNLTVYPPLAQLVFAAGYLLTPGRLLGMQLLWMLAELAAWLILARELRATNRPRRRLLLLAWAPLLLFTGYLPGHIDLLYLPFVMGFLVAVRSDRPVVAGLLLGLTALIKPFPLILLPAAVAEFGIRRSARTLSALAATVLLFYLPFLTAGYGLVSSMVLMAEEWSFNGSLAAGLEQLMPMTVAHVVSWTIFLLLIAATFRIRRDFLSRCLLAGAAFAICTPTLFPWYLAFLLPLLALRPDPALLALTILAPLSDLILLGYLDDGIWHQPLWTGVVEYGVFYGLLIVGARRRWGMFRGG